MEERRQQPQPPGKQLRKLGAGCVLVAASVGTVGAVPVKAADWLHSAGSRTKAEVYGSYSLWHSLLALGMSVVRAGTDERNRKKSALLFWQPPAL